MIDYIKKYWNDVEALQSTMLSVIERQLAIAEEIADKELQFDSIYLSEKDSAYKATDGEIKAKVRTIVGTEKTKLEYEFIALRNLLDVITLRVAQLSNPQGASSIPPKDL